MKRKLLLLFLLVTVCAAAVLTWNAAGFSRELPDMQITLPIIGTIEAAIKGTPTMAPVLPLPLPTPDGDIEPGRVCFTSLTRGVTCLDDGGWQVYTQDNGALAGDQIRDASACPTGEFVVVSSLGISVFDGKAWSILRPEGYAAFTAAACEGSNSWWIAHNEGVSHYDGKDWTLYPASLYLTEGMQKSIIDIAAAPDGDIWLALSDMIVRKHGSEWVVFSRGDGLDGVYIFEGIQVDSSGAVWAMHHDGLLRYSEGEWLSLTTSDFPYPRALAFTKDMRVWAATDQGLWVYADGNWQSYTNANSSLRRDDLYAVALDGSGRLWLGTDWGVDVFDPVSMRTYYMFDSSLLDDQVQAILVAGVGPGALPATVVETSAGLIGSILDGNGKPLANARVQICMGAARLRYKDTPCEESLFIRETSTANDGSFGFMDLPEGLYRMTVETSPNNWALLRNELGAPDRVYVAAGLQNDVSDLFLP